MSTDLVGIAGHFRRKSWRREEGTACLKNPSEKGR